MPLNLAKSTANLVLQDSPLDEAHTRRFEYVIYAFVSLIYLHLGVLLQFFQVLVI